MKKYEKIKSLILSIISSPVIRFDLSLLLGLAMNLVYITGNFLSAVLYRSLWSATVTAYHSFFVVMRTYLIYSRGRLEEYRTDSRKIHLVCFRVGITLLLLDFLASAMMLYTVRQNRQVEYSGIVLLGFLIYTLYSLLSSLYGMKKWKNDNQPLHFAAKNMTLAASLMSFFNLQYSLLSSLGAGTVFIRWANTAGGVAIFLIIIFLALRLIVRSASGASLPNRKSQNS